MSFEDLGGYYDAETDGAAIEFVIAWLRRVCGKEEDGCTLRVQPHGMNGSIVLEYPDDTYLTDAGWRYVFACRRVQSYFEDWWNSSLVTDAEEHIRAKRLARRPRLFTEPKNSLRAAAPDVEFFQDLLTEAITVHCYQPGHPDGTFDADEPRKRLCRLEQYLRQDTVMFCGYVGLSTDSPADLAQSIVANANSAKILKAMKHRDFAADLDCYALINMLDHEAE